MRRIFLTISVVILALQSVAYAANLVIQPTTTVRLQTANNTSAANGFVTQANGNAGPGNISKLDIHSLLYPGAHTKIYAHLMLWFGTASHMNVGYSSTDRVQVGRQIRDMVTRGIDGVIIDWYGQGTVSDQATLQVMKVAEANPGFTFAIMVDAGAIRDHSCAGCTPQQALIKHLQYIEQTYFGSPAYMRIEGRPVVTNFDIDLSFQIDWKAMYSALASDPDFIFQNNNGFTHSMSGGSYSWVKPTATDYGAGYLTSFYKTAKTHSGMEAVGATYKGFNDTLAKWGSNRIMDQQCGQTWLQTFSKINSLYDSGNQLDALQLVTWNDYEEGTEIESGIDNCVSISSSVSKNSLNWSVTGNENTVDHYRVYVSSDGKNLMPLTDMNTGNSSLDLCSFSLATGSYQMFVQGVGKPSMRNQITAPVAYSPNCGGGGGTTIATITLQAMPSSLNIHLGHSATTTINVNSSGAVATPITLGCSNLPVGMTCTFAPAVVSADSGNVTSTLSISAAATSASLGRREPKQGFVYASLFAFGMFGIVSVGQIKRKRIFQSLMVLTVTGAAVLLCSCGGGGTTSRAQTVSNYTITVAGTSDGAQMSTTTMSVSVE